MAIRFATSSLSDVDYNLYNIEKFNGVDYTTTPTLVDDSRAIEISNYVPKGDSLVKRNGASMVFELKFEDAKGIHLLNIHDIWEDPINKKHHFVFATEKTNEGYVKPAIYSVMNMFDLNNVKVEIAHKFDYNYTTEPLMKLDDLYSFGKYFEGKLFVLCMNEYLMTIDGEDGKSTLDFVSNYAYIPTVVIGLGAENSGITTSSSFEEFNLLTNKCYMELYRHEEKEKYYFYNIGQFFSENQTFTITKINGVEVDIDLTQMHSFYVNGIGYFSCSKYRGRKLEFFNSLKEGDTTKVEEPYIKIEIEFTRVENEDLASGMRFGVAYGSYGHRDRLFLSGNPNHPNLDIHSCESNDTENGWRDYTYFGDNSYAFVGTSDTAIKGYGFLNNGSMAIFKESKTDVPNLYIRTYEMRQDSDGNYKEVFPITISGLSLDIPVEKQIISYGNDLLVNAPTGIYKIMAGESTATQTYKSQEVSYFIRENLGENVSDSSYVVYKDKLYISREDKKGNKRVYIADRNRYSYIDGNLVYEWFVLDGLDVDKFYIFDRKLYFTNAKGLFHFNDIYEDEYFTEIKDANVGDETFSSEVFVDEEKNQVILSSSNKKLKEITLSQECYDEWNNFKKKTKIKFGNDIYIPINNNYFHDFTQEEDNWFTFIFKYSNSNDFTIPILIQDILQKDFDIDNAPALVFDITEFADIELNGNAYGIESITFGDEGYELHCKLIEGKKIEKANGYSYPFLAVNNKKQDFWFDVYELYCFSEITEKEYPFSMCELNDDGWYYRESNEEYEYIGSRTDLFFNRFTLKHEENLISFTSLKEQNAFRNVVLKFTSTITSYWRSKFNALGRLDFLKTIDRTTFVADAIRGGKTEIGYKTTFKKSNSQVGLLYKNEIGIKDKLSSVQTALVVKEKNSVAEKDTKHDLDFNQVDFSYFTFSSYAFAQTYTSKKKIKNFSFVQLTFESNQPEDSTIVSLSLRYKYTRNNKGVK